MSDHPPREAPHPAPEPRCPTCGATLARPEGAAGALERAPSGTWAIDDPRRWFVDGVAWWEHQRTDAAIWPLDRPWAEAEAERRYARLAPPARPSAEGEP